MCTVFVFNFDRYYFTHIDAGVAHYRSMCNPESSCLAVLDRGFGTGYIIAHELGHQ